jgi:RND family efflux transporter MFP subunit
MRQNRVNRHAVSQQPSILRRIVGIYVSDTLTRIWRWLLMVAIAGGATCSLFLAATDAQDTRDTKPLIAHPGWLTFDQCLVVAPESYEIAAKETGVIAELTIRENDLVKSGQPIGQLDSENAEIEREMAAIQLQIANERAKDDSEVGIAESVAEETMRQLRSSEELVNKGGTSDSDVRQKAIAVKQAKAQLIKRNYERVEKEKQGKLAESSYKLAEIKVRRLKLSSPATGTVARIDRRAGEWVAAGTTVAKVIRLDELRVDFFVDMKQVILASLQDQPVTITADFGIAGNKDFAGKITGYASEVGSTGKVRVSATVQNQQINDRWILLPGMPAVLKLLPKS